MAEIITSGQVVPKITEGLHLMDGIEGLRSLPRHSVDMLLTDPPYGTTKNYWDTPLPLPELWEAIRWAVKPNGAVLLFAQCPFDKVLGASNLAMLRYEWVWVKAKATGFLNANRAPLKKTAEATEKAASGIVAFVKRHPVGVALFAVLLLVLVLLQSCMSSMVSMGNGALGAVSASTYQAEDADIRAAERAYCEMEAELQEKLDNYENDHDYDEYHFDLDDIEHDLYVLISILSAWHEGAWTIDEVQGTLQMLFEKQYILTEDVVRETRYRTETRTGTRLVYDEDLDEYVEEEYEYEVEVPYYYYICTVTLENFNLSHLPIYIMGEDKLSRYALYMATLGNRTDLFPTSSYVGKYTSEPFLYEVPEEYLANETFAAIYEEAQKYIGYPYVWGGYKPSTSFDCSGYVSWVYNQCGWDFGRLGAQGLYNISTRVRNPQPGDLVFFTGTYDTPGVSHVGIYVGDGWMLHCGDPIGYADLSASYWQSHFYAYGRLS